MLTLQGCCGAEIVAHADGLQPGLRSESATPCWCCRARPGCAQTRAHAEAICTHALLRLQSRLGRLDHSPCCWCLQNVSTALLMLQGKLGRMQKFLDKLHKGEQTSVSFLGASVSTAYCLHETIG